MAASANVCTMLYNFERRQTRQRLPILDVLEAWVYWGGRGGGGAGGFVGESGMCVPLLTIAAFCPPPPVHFPASATHGELSLFLTVVRGKTRVRWGPPLPSPRNQEAQAPAPTQVAKSQRQGLLFQGRTAGICWGWSYERPFWTKAVSSTNAPAPPLSFTAWASLRLGCLGQRWPAIPGSSAQRPEIP